MRRYGRWTIPIYREPVRGFSGTDFSASDFSRLQFFGQRKQRHELYRGQPVPLDRERVRLLQGIERHASINCRSEAFRRSGEDDVGIVRAAARNVDRAAMDMAHKFVAAQPEADPLVHLTGARGVDHRAERHHDRCGAERQAGIMPGMPRRPAAEHLDQRFRLPAPFGQFVHLHRCGCGPARAAGPIRFASSPSSRCVSILALMPLRSLRSSPKRRGPNIRLAHDQDRPALADHFQRERRPAGVVIPAIFYGRLQLSFFL